MIDEFMFVAPLIYLLQFVTNILSIESLVNGHFQDFNVRYTAFEFKEQFIFFVFEMIIRIQKIVIIGSIDVSGKSTNNTILFVNLV